MTQRATYTLGQFMNDVRQAFASTKDPRAQAQAVVQHMRALLAVPGWRDEQLRSLPAGYGRVDLHMDDAYGHPEPGFLAMCSAQRQGEVAFFLPGEIHTTKNVHEGRSLVFRLEAQRLDQVMRHRYNPQENAARAFRAATSPLRTSGGVSWPGCS